MQGFAVPVYVGMMIEETDNPSCCSEGVAGLGIAT
jgi:hypothetical protein